ncbi:hypothetical protein TWF569_003794 [Orbilia oligospora]|uniref:Uncharacterized protein n=1 Tax=Orbilia oligospora TaxID=2813651 RepID=A0A7C8N5W5_ORBOL|nr:hypothetical protein TWF102_011771 [Orbilia oligospora]KAF3104551.1 hypothetical protein TWF103_006875 [Orbilia oligospora]KAF3116406.1 hypothetical protein TWF706_004046 [Orbilia oligospora]KAF3151666.1 hypothetical protein TWF569_003794 [Orbilia oligospora]
MLGSRCFVHGSATKENKHSKVDLVASLSCSIVALPFQKFDGHKTPSTSSTPRISSLSFSLHHPANIRTTNTTNTITTIFTITMTATTSTMPLKGSRQRAQTLVDGLSPCYPDPVAGDDPL